MMVIFKTTVPLNAIELAVIESSKEHFNNASKITNIDDVIVNICGSEYDGCRFIHPNKIICSIYRLRDDLRRDIYYAPYHEFGHVCLASMKIPQKLGDNIPHEITKDEFMRYYPNIVDCPDDIYTTSINDIVSVIPEYIADVIINKNTEVNEYYIDWIKRNHTFILERENNDRNIFINMCRIIANNKLLQMIGDNYRINNIIENNITNNIEHILSISMNNISPNNIVECMANIYSTYIDFLSKRE